MAIISTVFVIVKLHCYCIAQIEFLHVPVVSCLAEYSDDMIDNAVVSAGKALPYQKRVLHVIRLHGQWCKIINYFYSLVP